MNKKISDSQKQVLDSLVCERLSSDEQNLRLVNGFCNYKNPALADVILNEAFEEDEGGSIAYYIVKHSLSNKVLFYFSLKSGMLFDQHLDEKKYEALNEWVQKIEQKAKDASLASEEKQFLFNLKEKIRSHKGLKKVELERLSRNDATIFDDLKLESNSNITHVLKTYSGVELVHFCSNSDTNALWESYNMPQPLGAVVFWHFIVPLVLSVKRIVGCEYLFLFAADSTDDQTLVEYYRNILNFDDSKERAVVKPVYDFSCKFMYQETTPLAKMRQDFFDNFNSEY